MKKPALPIHSGGTALALQDLMQSVGLSVKSLDHSFIERDQSESSLVCMALDIQNNLIVTGGYDGVLKCYNLQSGRCEKSFIGHKGWVSSQYLHPEKIHLASGSHDGTAKIWDVNTGNCLKTFPHENIVYGVVTDRSGRFLFTGCKNGSIYQFDIASGKCVKVFRSHLDAIRCLALTSDSKTLISSSNDSTIRVWDVKTGRCLNTLIGHANDIYSISLSSDEKFLASGSQDETARLWDINTGRCRKVFSGHADPVRPVYLSNDATQLLTGSFDTTARLWDTSTGKCLVIYEGGHTDWLRCVRMTPDGNRVITGSKDGTICFWDTKTGELLVKLYNIDRGFLWSTPPCSDDSNGFFWTDREDLIKVQSRKNKEGQPSCLDNNDLDHTEYLASHNNRTRVMQRLQPSRETIDADTELIEKFQYLDRMDYVIKQLMPPDFS